MGWLSGVLSASVAWAEALRESVGESPPSGGSGALDVMVTPESQYRPESARTHRAVSRQPIEVPLPDYLFVVDIAAGGTAHHLADWGPIQPDSATDQYHRQHAAALLEGLLLPQLLRSLPSTFAAELPRSGIWDQQYSSQQGLRSIRVVWTSLGATLGGMQRVSVVVRDQTEARRSAHFSYERERDFRTIVENCPDPIVRYDIEGRRTFTNAAHAAATGIPILTGLGKTPWQFGVFDDKTAATYEEALLRVLRTGNEEEVIVRFPLSSEAARTFSVRLVAERDERGQLIGALAIGREQETDAADTE